MGAITAGLIHNIAGQINLLALNTASEARNLADQAAKATPSRFPREKPRRSLDFAHGQSLAG